MHLFLRRFGFLLLLFFCAMVDASPTRYGNKMASQDDADNINVALIADGGYRVNVRNKPWLFSAATFFNVNGQRYTQNENLKLVAKVTANGTDSFGRFKLVTFQYQAGTSEIMTSIKTYQGQPLVYFSQAYVNGANKTRAEAVDHTISGFPSFNLVEVKTGHGPLGYLAFGGIHCADTGKKFGIFSPEMDITGGLAGGPMALFDGGGDTLIISPASNFMAVSNWHQREGDKNRLVYGIMGGVDEVPAGTAADFILYYSSQGVNRAFEDWGRRLQEVYGRTDTYVLSDMAVNYLGYYTDNGAYYYYKTEPDKNYQDTMLDAKAYADEEGIPYRYLQFDSWWYYKGVGGGVKTWEARPDVFPKGLQFVYNKTGLRSVCHNRYWSSDTTYATHNGGRYNFIVDAGSYAVPDDQIFWNDLLANASSWGLHTYEQDWLNKEFAGTKALLSDITLGARWLDQMAAAAVKNGMTIQYCMANSRHVMQALKNSVVTQVRASDDYRPGGDQWKIGVSSIFAYAMGITPFKDNFWSTTDQPGNKYKASEPFNELQMAVSVLSTGPVAPSDGIGFSNTTLLMRCCNAEGLILKPSKPATAIDDQIYKEAFPSFKSPDGEVWSTYSNISGLLFGIIFVPELRAQYNITPSKAGFQENLEDLRVFEAHNVQNLAVFSDEEPLQLFVCNRSQPCIYHATPVLSANRTVVLLGELQKIVPVSPQRITRIDVFGEEVKVYLRGVPNERVQITFSMESNLMTVSCVVGPTRTAVVNLTAQTCQ